MSKTWYPMINDEKCTECGLCVDKCTHGVYDKEKAPRPVVIHSEGCVEGCVGCGDLCPNNAIDYFGDREKAALCGCGDNKSDSSNHSGCGCGSEESGVCGCGGEKSGGCGCGGNCR